MPPVQESRLKGKFVFLSASLPAKEALDFPQFVNQSTAIDDAVIGLARAIFFNGGRLVFGAHPSISRLVARVAGEYGQTGETSVGPPVVIYQSRAFEEHIPEDTMRMQRMGWAQMVLVEAETGEVFRPGRGRGSIQCPRSLAEMRRRMIEDTKPEAMVCVGGMEGVIEEFDFFISYRESFRRKRPIPIYILSFTGGAAQTLAARGDPSQLIYVVDERSFPDQLSARYQELMQRSWEEFAPESSGAADSRIFVPNRLLGVLAAERIIADISRGENH
jgi:hypothetical protein